MAQSIEDRLGQAHFRILGKSPPHCFEIRIRVGRQQGDLVEELELAGRELDVARRLHSPDIPGQDFATVEGREVANQTSGDEPEAAQLREFDAEHFRIQRAAAASAPGIGRSEELLARHIEDVVADREIADEDLVELRVEQRPAALVRLPVFADPVILELSWVEVSAEAAPAPGGHAMVAKDGDGEQHEMPANADEPPLRRTGNIERLPVQRHDCVDHLLHWPDVALGTPCLGKRTAVKGLRHMLVDHNPWTVRAMPAGSDGNVSKSALWRPGVLKAEWLA